MSKHIPTKEIIELEKKKDPLKNQVKILSEQNIKLGQIIDRFNEEKEAILSTNSSLKATILDVEMIKEGSKEKHIEKLKMQLIVL
jgi:hypothetical protein